MTTTGATKQRSYDGDYMDAGMKAQDIVIKFLRKAPNIIGVDDISHLKIIQEADVDCMIKTIDGRVTLAEIKSDKHLGTSGNVLFEILRINHTCLPDHSLTLGWSGRTPAKWLLYYAPVVNKIYQIKTDDLRKAMQQYTMEKRKGARLDYVCTDNIKSTINILIPMHYCEKYFIIHNLEITNGQR